jgi:hypothetical protein
MQQLRLAPGVAGRHAARWLALAALAWLVLAFPVLARGQGIGPRPGGGIADPARLYDLERDEALGGHTLARHVGRTDEQLAERLRREPQISAASTYPDAIMAKTTVALAIQQARARIDPWAARRGPRPNLVIDYVQRTGGPIGRSLSRGARVAEPCDRALVVLRWLERERTWIVLTSYPETRR